MNNKVLVWILVAAVVLVGGIYMLTRGGETTSDLNGTGGTTQNDNSGTATAANQGRVVFSVTDAAANLSSVSEVNMMISKVEAHHMTSGWATVSTAPKTYNLLDLNKNKYSKILADVKMKTGSYDQVRLTIDSVAMKSANVSQASEAKLVARTLTLPTMLIVKEGKTASVNFDFLADKSLHKTEKGEYVFAPVVKSEAKSETTVMIDGSSTVTMSGGKLDNTNTSGMDTDGSVKANFTIDATQKLRLDGDAVIKINTTANTFNQAP